MKKMTLIICIIFLFTLTAGGIKVVIPVYSSNLSVVDSIPFLEPNMPSTGTLIEAEGDIGQAIKNYYVSIDPPGSYNLTLTMPSEVSYVTAEFRTIINFKTDYGEYKIPQIVYSAYYSDFDEDHESRSEDFSLLIDYTGDIGLTLTIWFSKPINEEKTYEILLSSTPIVKASSIEVSLNPTLRSIDRIFELDLTAIGVNQAGYYNLSALFTINNRTNPSSSYYDYYFNGYTRVQGQGSMGTGYFYESYNFAGEFWSLPSSHRGHEIVYLNPEEKYYINMRANAGFGIAVQEVKVFVQFRTELFGSEILPVDGSVSIPANKESLVRVDIPQDDSIKITVDHSSTASFDLGLRSFLSSTYSRSYGTTFGSTTVSTTELSYIQLARRDAGNDLIDIGSLYSMSGLRLDNLQIVVGGIINSYTEERSSSYYLGYEHGLSADLVSLLLPSSDDPIYIHILSNESVTLNSESVPIDNVPLNDETIDLMSDDPFRMYNVETAIEDHFTFEVEMEIITTNPSVSEDDSEIDELYTSNYTTTNNALFLPDYPIPMISYASGFQIVSMSDGNGLLICTAGYRLYSSAYLNTADPNYQNIMVDDVKFQLSKATVTTKLTRDKVPEVGDLLSTVVNISQPVKWFSFPVEKDAIYNVTIEPTPFSAYHYIFIIDREGRNPFHGINAFTTTIGMSTTVVGKENTKGYFVIVGNGLVKLSIQKIGKIGSAPGLELIGVLLMIPVITVYNKKRKK